MANSINDKIKEISLLETKVRQLEKALSSIRDFSLSIGGDQQAIAFTEQVRENLEYIKEEAAQLKHEFKTIGMSEKGFADVNDKLKDSKELIDAIIPALKQYETVLGDIKLPASFEYEEQLNGLKAGLDNLINGIIKDSKGLDININESVNSLKNLKEGILYAFSQGGQSAAQGSEAWGRFNKQLAQANELIAENKRLQDEQLKKAKEAEVASREADRQKTIEAKAYITGNKNQGPENEVDKLKSQMHEALTTIDAYIKKFDELKLTGTSAYSELTKAQSAIGSKYESIDNIEKLEAGYKILKDVISEAMLAEVEYNVTTNSAWKEHRDEIEKTREELKKTQEELERAANLGNTIDQAIVMNVTPAINTEELSSMAQEASVKVGEAFNKVEPSISFESIKHTFSAVGNVLKQLNTLCNAIINTIKKLVSIATSGFKLMGKAIGTVVSTTKNILTLFGSLSDRVRSIGDAIDPIEALKDAFKGITDAVSDGIEKLGNFGASIEKIFNNSVTERANELFTSVYSLVNIVGPEEANNVINWAKNLEYAFGLSSAGLITNLNKLTGVMYGVGIAAKDVGTASKNFSFLSEYFVGQGLVKDAETAINAFTAAMRGSGRAVSQLGIVMSDNALDQYLKKLKETGKISKEVTSDFTALSTEAKAYVRYSYLVSQAAEKYDLGNYANNINTVTGRMHALNSALLTLRHTIGTGLYKALASLAPLITSLLKLVNMAVVQIFKLFNIDVSISPGMNEGAGAVSGVGDAANESTESLKEMEEAANKAKGAVLGFDKVTSLYTPTDSGKSGVDDLSDFDYSGLIGGDLFDIEDIQGKTEDIFDILKKKTEDFEAWAKRKIRGFEIFNGSNYFREDFDLEFDWDRIKENLGKIHENIKQTIENWTDFFIVIGLKILDDINIGRIVTEFTEFLRAASELARVMSEVLTPALDAFYELGLKPIVEWIGNRLAGALIFATSELDKWSAWFIENKSTIYSFFESLGRIVASVWGVFEPYFDAAWDWLESKISGIGEAFRGVIGALMGDTIENEETIIDKIETWPERIDDVIKKIKLSLATLSGSGLSLEQLAEQNTALSQSDAAMGKLKAGEDLTGDETFSLILQALYDINQAASAVFDIVVDIGKAFGEWATTEALPWILEQLSDLGSWLSEHKDGIVDLLKEIGGFAWDGFKLFVDVVKGLIDYLVDNPDVLKTFFGVFIGTSIAKEVTSVASGLTMVSIGAKGLVSALSALGPIMPTIAGIAAAIGLVVAAFKHLKETSETFNNILSDVGNRISEAFSGLTELFTGGEDSEDGLFSDLITTFNDMVDALEPLLDILTAVAGNGIAWLLDELGNLATFVTGTLVNVMDILSGLGKIISGIFTLDPDLVKEGLGQIIGSVIDWILSWPEMLGTSISNFMDFILGAAVDIGNNMIDGFKDGVTEKWENVKTTVNKIWTDFIDGVKNFFGIHSPSTVFDDIGTNIIQGLFNGIKETWDTLSGKINDIWDGAVKGIKDAFEPIGEWFSETFTEAKDLAVKAWDGIGKTFEGIRDTVANAFSGLGDKIKGFFSSAKEKAESAWGSVKLGVQGAVDFVTGNKRQAQNPVSMHAVGGSIAGGQLFIANENGAELVGKISGASGAQVANNAMITKAIQEASRLGIQAGLSPLINKLGVDSGKTINIKFENGTLVTPDAMRAFAMDLATLINSSNINIANTGFSI